MIEGAIFDLDGTLFDSMMIWDTVAEEYLNSLGVTAQKGINERVRNLSLNEAANLLHEEYLTHLSVTEIVEGINKTVEHYYRDIVMPKNGVCEFLADLAEKKVKMCIASATDKYQVEVALKRCGIDKYFSEIFICTEIGYGKDEPHIYRAALQYLQTPKDKTAVFEDALYAVKTAKADGFITVAVYDKYELHRSEISDLSDIQIADYTELSDFWKAIEKI